MITESDMMKLQNGSDVRGVKFEFRGLFAESVVALGVVRISLSTSSSEITNISFSSSSVSASTSATLLTMVFPSFPFTTRVTDVNDFRVGLRAEADESRGVR